MIIKGKQSHWHYEIILHYSVDIIHIVWVWVELYPEQRVLKVVDLISNCFFAHLKIIFGV